MWDIIFNTGIYPFHFPPTKDNENMTVTKLLWWYKINTDISTKMKVSENLGSTTTYVGYLLYLQRDSSLSTVTWYGMEDRKGGVSLPEDTYFLLFAVLTVPGTCHFNGKLATTCTFTPRKVPSTRCLGDWVCKKFGLEKEVFFCPSD